jgi:UrcA family protein
MNAIFAAAALSAALAVATPSSADQFGKPTNFGPMKVEVIASSRGLNLRSEEGARVFLDRLSLAAARACEERSSPIHMLARTRGFSSCRQAALALAISQVRSPAVRRQYAETNPAGNPQLAHR